MDWLERSRFSANPDDGGPEKHATPREFLENAPRINQFLKDWNAAGFGSGFRLIDVFSGIKGSTNVVDLQ